jgi:hypothetical protein
MSHILEDLKEVEVLSEDDSSAHCFAHIYVLLDNLIVL